MGIKQKNKPALKKAASRAEKMIKVTPSTHRSLKIEAAKRGESIGEMITHLVNVNEKKS